MLQPVLYGLAAEQLLGATVESGRLFYCTQRGGYAEEHIPLNEKTRGAASRVIEAVDASIAAGFLPAFPKKGACEYCDYRPACGPYEEIRTGKKIDDERLDPLANVRNLP